MFSSKAGIVNTNLISCIFINIRWTYCICRFRRWVDPQIHPGKIYYYMWYHIKRLLDTCTMNFTKSIKIGPTYFYDRKVLESTKIININFMNLKLFEFFFIYIGRLNNKCKLQHWNEKSRLDSFYKIIDIVLKDYYL